MTRKIVYFSLAMPGLPKTFLWAGCFLLLAAAPVLRALEEPTSFVLNLPFAANEATPLWLGHPETPQTTFATLNLPISSPDPNASLLVTIYFHEKEGGFLRVSWQGPQGAQILTNNIYEGIGMDNQRSLLVSAATLLGDGTLSFQCGDATLGIERVKLEWLETRNGLVSPQVQDLLVTSANKVTEPAQNLDGQPRQADAPAWHGKLVTVPIVDSPQRIEQGVEFNVQLDDVPGAARVELKEAGLAWGKELVVWVNQQRAGTITPAVPNLGDEGYLPDSPKTYVGWRTGSFYVPASLLKAQENTVQFSVEDEIPSDAGSTAVPATDSPAPLAIKDAILQFNYPIPSPTESTEPAESAPTPTPQASPSTSMPTETSPP